MKFLNTRSSRVLSQWVILFAVIAIAASCAQGKKSKSKSKNVVKLPAKTQLDDYIAKPDPSFEWKLVKTVPGKGYTSYILDMKSQTWRDEKEVNKPLWQHWVTIIKPDVVESDIALLFINGGSNRSGQPPNKPSSMFVGPAQQTKSVVVELAMIPNQPLIFNGDGKERSEDDLIAYTWDKVMTTGDATWNARFPMVKSAVRAMDATQAFLKSPDGGDVSVKKFVVAGGSKRGWTTWLTGAVDSRVVAIIPFVIDILNVPASMKHHWAAYGFWAPAVGDYVAHKIPGRADTPEHKFLMDFEDPFSYRHRLLMPKYIVNAAGDQFFLPDSSQFYFSKLRGVKYLRYVPNADHGLNGSDAPQSFQAFYQAILKGTPLPKFSWKKQKDGSLLVTCVDKPKVVNLWQATNPETRDFRVEKIGRAYKSTTLEAQADGTYLGAVSAPEKGFTAFFVELVYDSGFAQPFKFTTEVSVVPDVLPFKDKPFD